MRVSEVMTRGVECTRPDATLQEAARRMKDLDVGALPVCHNDRLVGMLTDRDIAVRSVAEGHDPRADRVNDILTPDLVYCFEDQDVNEVAELMRAKQVRRLPVLNRDKRLLGIVALGDLAVRPGHEDLSGHVLEGISEPATAKT